MSKNINIKIDNLTAHVLGNPIIICNNTGYKIIFLFDSDWDNYDVKTAKFAYKKNGKLRSEDVVFTGNLCPIPKLTEVSYVMVGVFAGDLQTTTPATIRCVKSILDYDGLPEEPSSDVYAQLIEMINSGQIKGDTGPQGPKGDMGADGKTPHIGDNGNWYIGDIDTGKPSRGDKPDWNQNDSTAADYIKNRPFYAGDPVETEIVNVSLDFRQQGSIYVYYGTDFAGESFEIGQTYQVTFDDSTYDCTAFLLEGLGCLGNPSLLGVQIEGSADIPFAIARNPETSIVYTTMDGASHSLKIVVRVREINKIDKKYIPTLDYLDKKNPTGVGSFGMNRKINSDIGVYSVALGEECVASGTSSISAGANAKATELTAQAFGYGTEANARFSHAEGYNSKVSIDASEKVIAYEPETGAGRYGHAEGFDTLVTGGIGAHAEGALTLASGDSSHAEGYKTTASERYSHAEGESTTASGRYSHAEGCTTTASGYQSHAEGYKTTASGDQSHAEGYEATASGRYSHAEGESTTASKDGSHAEGIHTIASGRYSHAEGTNTIASSDYQHVQGYCNVEDSSGIYAHIVGNGANPSSRSNAHTLDWSGNAWFAGTVEGKALILSSSTQDSTKKFKITVDDSGTISATEVT